MYQISVMPITMIHALFYNDFLTSLCWKLHDFMCSLFWYGSLWYRNL